MTHPPYFLDTVSMMPATAGSENAEHHCELLMQKAREYAAPEIAGQIAAAIAHPNGKILLQRIFTCSPFLSRLLLQFTDWFAAICTDGPDACFASLVTALQPPFKGTGQMLMKELRIAKNKASLLIAVADIAERWDLQRVTSAMSLVAGIALRQALGFQLAEASRKGLIVSGGGGNLEEHSGLFVLAMGKLGAHELNYSSDIDLIVFFDRERVRYTGTQNMEQCFSRIVNDTVRMLQERTAEGYVFRVDLRLRPDPSSTPVALSTAGALTYYETVGQNWERAAFIKARVIAGDLQSGQAFLKQIAPFLWRKHLDFAAIADIQSIKRQMDVKSGGAIRVAGHNIKTGLGGIREIEFFAQIHQLIWGGRIAALRISGTCDTLLALAVGGIITASLADSLIESYGFLRMVEHRLQMVDDQQTHSIPHDPHTLLQLAAFLGFSDTAAFETVLLAHLQHVHMNFSGAFKGAGSLGEEGTLSFTGVENNPETLKTIAAMGYRNAASVSEIIQGWHRGANRATRNQRARELITELTPMLLKALASNADPDQAFMHFSRFLGDLPSGVQIFSLFNANPQLLDLIAVIMGCAPAMAENLSKNPHLLDIVLTADFADTLPGKGALRDELAAVLSTARDLEDEIDSVRRFKNERQFQAGVKLLRRQASIDAVSRTLSDIADTCLELLLERVETSFRAKYPQLPSGKFCVVALGRLGARQMTFGSDIDLLFVYDASEPFADMHGLYNKLAQRFITALTLLTREGRLYNVDSRLRPSGNDGALAVGLEALDKYCRESAWTFELMAYVRARALCGDENIRDKVASLFTRCLTAPHARPKIKDDLLQLRDKITQEFGSGDPWNLKYAHGGIMDINFLAQYLTLLHAHQYPQLIHTPADDIWNAHMNCGIIPTLAAEELSQAQLFLNSLYALQRLYGAASLKQMRASRGMSELIAGNLHMASIEDVEVMLQTVLANVRKYWAEFMTL